MTAHTIDNTLIAAYSEFDIPVDCYFADSGLTESFTIAIRQRIGDDALDSKSIMHRLLTLRKKGLLPRLRRAYHGRNDRTQ